MLPHPVVNRATVIIQSHLCMCSVTSVLSGCKLPEKRNHWHQNTSHLECNKLSSWVFLVNRVSIKWIWVDYILPICVFIFVCVCVWVGGWVGACDMHVEVIGQLVKVSPLPGLISGHQAWWQAPFSCWVISLSLNKDNFDCTYHERSSLCLFVSPMLLVPNALCVLTVPAVTGAQQSFLMAE